MTRKPVKRGKDSSCGTVNKTLAASLGCSRRNAFFFFLPFSLPGVVNIWRERDDGHWLVYGSAVSSV